MPYIDDLVQRGLALDNTSPDPEIADLVARANTPVDTSRTLKGTLQDVAVTAGKGLVALPQAAIGIADLPTGGAVGKGLESVGYDLNQLQEDIGSFYSPAQQEAFQKVQDAEGITGKIATAVENPSTILHTVGESLPVMVAGGRIGSGLANLAPKVFAEGVTAAGKPVANVLAAAAGEGVVGAGASAEAIRSETEDGYLTPGQVALAGTVGGATTAFTLLGGKIAKHLGIGDIDVILAGGAKANAAKVAGEAAKVTAKEKGIVRRFIEGAVSEGVLEELPQSVSEQVLQNVALDKDPMEGVDYAAAMGLLAGMAMGGPVAAVTGGSQRDLTQPPPTNPQFDPNDTGLPPLPPDAVTPPPAPPAGPLSRAVQTVIPTVLPPTRAPLSQQIPGQTTIDAEYTEVPLLDQQGRPVLPAPEAGLAALPEPQSPQPATKAGGRAPGPTQGPSVIEAGTGLTGFYDQADERQVGAEPTGGTNGIPNGIPNGTENLKQGETTHEVPVRQKGQQGQTSLPDVRQDAQGDAGVTVPLRNDIVTKAGTPFRTEGVANEVMRSKDLTESHEVVEVSGGFALREKATPAASAQQDQGLDLNKPPAAAAAAETPVGPTQQETAKGFVYRKRKPATLFKVTDPGFAGGEKYVFARDHKGILHIIKPDGTTTKVSDGLANRVEIAEKQGQVASYKASSREMGSAAEALGTEEAATETTTPPTKEELKAERQTVNEKLAAEGASEALVIGKKAAFLRKIAGAFGKQIIFAKGIKGNGKVFLAHANTIVINQDAVEKAGAWVTGHEMLHLLKQESPELYRTLYTTASKYTRGFKTYLADTKTHGIDRNDYTNDADYELAVAEEFLADTAGDLFQDSRFWALVLKEERTLFDKVKEILDKIYEKLGLMDAHYTDLYAIRDAMAEAFRAYGERSTKGNVAKEGGVGEKNAAAWHGSPHKFDKFSTEKIGTGEGAQVYGHGLYFAGKKEVAEWYKEKLSEGRSATYKGHPFDAYRNFTGPEDKAARHVLQVLNDQGLSIKDAITKAKREEEAGYKQLEAVFAKHPTHAYTQQMAREAQETIDTFDTLDPADFTLPDKGRLYKVELAPAEDEYILWDKPLSEQSEKVKAALQGVANQFKGDKKGRIEAYFRNEQNRPYQALVQELNGNQKKASEAFHKAGIRGIKYLDGTSRNAFRGQTIPSFEQWLEATKALDLVDVVGSDREEKLTAEYDAFVEDMKREASYNYVIFSEDDVEITEKYSRRALDPATSTGTAMVDQVTDLTGVPPTVLHSRRELPTQHRRIAKHFKEKLGIEGDKEASAFVDQYFKGLGEAYQEYVDQIDEHIQNYPDMATTAFPSNSDPTYEITVDLVSACVRMLRAMPIHKYVYDKGFDLTPFQMRALEVELNKSNFNLTCVYCYAFTRRANAIAKLDWMKDHLTRGVIPTTENNGKTKLNDEKQKLWQAAIAEATKDPKWERAFNALPDLVAIKAPADDKTLSKVSPAAAKFAKDYPAIHALKQKATDAGNLKMPTGTVAIAGQIVGISDEMIGHLSKWGGLRWQSSVDFVPMMTYDYVQGVVEMAIRGIPGHTYTKEIDLALLLADSGLKVNLSAAPLVRNGKVAWERDSDSNRRPKIDMAIGSMSWKDIETAMATSPNHAGVMMLGVNDEILDWASDEGSKYGPYVIPWHASGMPEIISQAFRAKDVVGAVDYQDPHETITEYESADAIPARFRDIAIEVVNKSGEKTGTWMINFSRLAEVHKGFQALADEYTMQQELYRKVAKVDDAATLTGFNIPTGFIIDQAAGVDDVAATKAYFELIDGFEGGLQPLFESYRSRFEERTGKHHGDRYWVFKKHYARTDTPLLPPDPKKLDFDVAKRLDTEWSKNPLAKAVANGTSSLIDASREVKLTAKQKRQIDAAIEKVRGNAKDPMRPVLSKNSSRDLDKLIDKYRVRDRIASALRGDQDGREAYIDPARFGQTPTSVPAAAENDVREAEYQSHQFFDHYELGEYAREVAAIASEFDEAGLPWADIEKYLKTEMEHRAKVDPTLLPKHKALFRQTNLKILAAEYPAWKSANEGTPGGVKQSTRELLAPNGKPSKLTPEQHATVRTPAFKKWFGDWEKYAKMEGGVWNDGEGEVSKVVDENGEPLVVFHGTVKGGFTEFDNTGQRAKVAGAFFFTPNRRMARTYSGHGEAISDFDSENQRGIYEVFLNIRNPQEEHFEGANWDGTRYDQYEVFDEYDEKIYDGNGRGIFSQEDADTYAEGIEGARVEKAPDHYQTTDGVVREAKNAGQDGAIIREVLDDGGYGENYEASDVFVAFKPEQVKSATHNRGTFNPKKADIRYSGRTLDVDGVERPTTNSKGRPIHQTEDGVRNFWRWYKGRTDKRGRPVVMYHGTPKDFTEFDVPAWFSEDPEDAEGYGKNVPVYVSIENPYRANDEQDEENRSELTELGYDEGFVDDLRSQGYDGAIGYRNGQTFWAVSFDRGQIKSVDNTGAFDGSNPDIRYSLRDLNGSSPWFSKLERIVDEKVGGKIAMFQLRAMLKNAGVSPAEIDQVLAGIDDKTVLTKQELLDHVKANTTEFEDVVLGLPVAKGEKAGWKLRYKDGSGSFQFYRNREDAEDDLAVVDPTGERIEIVESVSGESGMPAREAAPTQFATYVLPGAVEGSYREFFVTAPGLAGAPPSVNAFTWSNEDGFDTWQPQFNAHGVWIKYDAAEKEYLAVDSNGDMVASFVALDHAKKFVIKGALAAGAWRDGHSAYDQIKNPIVRIRYNERKGPNNSRVLFVEEMQGPSDSNQAKMPEWLRKRIYDIGVKRVIALAKAQGFDAVSWTTGEQQAERYDLSKQVESIGYQKRGELYQVTVWDKSGRQVWNNQSASAQDVEATIGKELLKKMDAGEGRKEYADDAVAYLEGLDLKVGGEGLKNLYDTMLPRLFAKYGKGQIKTFPGLGKEKPLIYTPVAFKGFGQYGVNFDDGNSQQIVRRFDTWTEAVDYAEKMNRATEPPRAPQAGMDVGSETPGSFTKYSNRDLAWSTPQQKVSSASTSISYPDPENKSPVIFTAFKRGDVALGPVNADIGGGRYNQITDWLKTKGVENVVWDRFNRPALFNEMAQKKLAGGKADTATVSNVLNVIPDAENRAVVIATAHDALKPGGKAFFSMYTAPKEGEVKGKDAYQVGKKTAEYIPEIEAIFGQGNVTRKGAVVTAVKASGRDLTKTPEFKQWFGDSKVVDADGKPLVVYHGTVADDITVFDKDKIRAVDYDVLFNGFWFSSDKETSPAMRDAKKVIPAYLSVKNPAPSTVWRKVVRDVYGEFNGTEDAAPSDTALREGARSVNDEVRYRLQDLGYDGINYDGPPTVNAKELEEKGVTSFQDRAGRWYTLEKSKQWYGGLDLYEGKGTINHVTGYSDLDDFMSFNDEHVWVVFEPEQIKSATGNLGTFDGNNPDIRYSARNLEAAFAEARQQATERIDYLRMKFQDRFLPLKRLQERLQQAGWIKTNDNDAYRAEELFHGKVAYRLEKLQEEYVQPLIDAIKASPVSMDELERYLYARHAKERNAHIKTLDPTMDAGSGMTDAEADQIMAEFDAAGKTADLQRLAARVDDISAFQRQVIRDGGLETPELVDAWEQFDHYVPLKGMPGDQEGDTFGRSVGRGANVSRSGTKKALGRRSEATKILANLMAQTGDSIIRAEKAEIGRAFLQMVEENPNAEGFRIIDPSNPGTMPTHRKVVDNPVRKRLAKKLSRRTYLLNNGNLTAEQRVRVQQEINDIRAEMDGQQEKVIRDVPDPLFKVAEDALAVTRDGKVVYIEIADKDLARVMGNLNPVQTSKVVQVLSAITRTLSMVNTSLNPEFVITNFERDLQTAMINLSGEKGAAMAKSVLKGVPSAMRGIRNALRGDKTHELADWYERYRKAGGKVSFMDLNSVDALEKQIRRDVETAGKHPVLQRTGKFFSDVGNFINQYNTVVENAVRLSAFKVAIENGMSESDAASIAKNLTVNFNRKGELGPAMNAAYMFFNAGVQGSARMIGALKSRRTQKIALGIVGLGVILAEMSRLVGGDDDDGENRWDKLDDYTKETNLVFLREDGSLFKVKMPYGYNLFVATGYAIDDAARFALSGGKEGKNPLDAAGFTTKVALNAFNPLNGGSPLQMASPTLLDPFVQVSENKNFMGTPLMPDKRAYGPPQPESQRYFSSVRSESKAVAEALNQWTGGSKYESGAIDISPEALDNFWDFATGGMGRFVADSANVGKLAAGETVPVRRLPFARQVFQEENTYVDRQRFTHNVDMLEAGKATIKELRESGDIRGVLDYMNQHPELRLYDFAKDTDKKASALLRQKRNTTDENLQHQIDAQLAVLYSSLNKRYREALRD